jgi:PTH1 family peptidyl-tRNA hydrolase
LLLNSTEYPRFRFGISDAFKKGQQVNYVLGEWDAEEKEKLKERLQISAEIVNSFALAGLNTTMNEFNGK